MITEDSLATAQLAQLFGSELLKVQSSARTDSGSVPQIVNIDPKRFLTNSREFTAKKSAEEQRLIQMLQREAEAAHPLPQQIDTHFPSELPVNVVQQTIQPISNNISSSSNQDPLIRIANSLERIANRFDAVDMNVKKRRIKRTK